jgi:ABC-type transport system involved in cytochrome c biogenesis ATPase subunit
LQVLLNRLAGDLNLTGAPGDGDITGQVHFVAHQDAIKLHLTVEENLTFWAGFLGGGNIEVALDAMNLRGLAASFRPSACPPVRSGGWAGPAGARPTPGLAAR